ncbi:hypothetical protein ACAG39_09015 [Caldicellulosiruptoraceae bacterium PP1]
MVLPFEIYPEKAYAGDKIIIKYNNGILLDNLQKDIYLIFGYGKEDIEKVYKAKMVKKDNAYIMVIPVIGLNTVFIAFEDSFNNKDDNNNSFYKIYTQKKE